MDVKSCNIADLTGIGLFPTLQILDCSNNQLTSVNLSQNAFLTTVTIYKNKLRGTYMDNFISNLFDRSGQATKGELRIIYNENASTGNQMTTEQVAAAKKKGWTPKQSTNGTTWTDYPGVVLINSTNFPDSKFQAWLKTQTYGQDGVLTPSEIAGVTSINVQSEAISDLTGINYFTALTKLNCIDNQLTNLNVSGCTALTKLNCYDNQLTNLDVSGCTALTELYCRGNQLTNLNVSGCTALTELDCYDNQLTNLDVSKNTALTVLGCYNNQLHGVAVNKLINSLPKTTEAGLYFIYNNVETPDDNEITTAQVKAAKEKGWTTYYWNNSHYDWLEYEGISITAGDLNNDSKIDAADVALLISYLTNPEAFEGEELALDVNADGEVNTDDLNALVSIIIGNE